ncbi:restriction endonuclease [uncultured Deinococcus sp.]|uniref:restriction endonuclease n=1 Tax=uncultured Deinococcus sp. TaxID=158789 RepID=UPI0025ECC608|nr:restriction endonuclease [uncultured Deinococcus sp.]
MSNSSKQGAEVLQALHKMLLSRRQGTFPHPEDLASALGLIGAHRAAILQDVVARDVRHRQSSGLDQIFKIQHIHGYKSIILTDYGRTAGPDGLRFAYSVEDLAVLTTPVAESGRKAVAKAAKTDKTQSILSIRQKLSAMDPYKFEMLVERVLRAMGVKNLNTTPQSRDSGIDVRGTLILEDVIHIKIAVQVKRYQNPVGSSEIQKLRGSLSNGEVGWFVTLSHFTQAAINEAEATLRQPISLIDGDMLIRLIEKYKVAII